MEIAEIQPPDVMVGLDIGSTKICAVAARALPDKNLDILGVGKVDTEGVRGGVISNMGMAVQAIRSAIKQCEGRCGFPIQNVFVGIAGHHIQGINMEGVVAVRSGVVDEQDVERVIDAARAFHAPDKELIHILSQEYIVDEHGGIKNAIGMAGKRLEAKVHIVLASTTSASNIIQACNMAELNVANIVLEPLASSLAVLLPDERQEGVILIDLGGSTSDILIFHKESIVFTSVLPIGGNNLTRDIAFGLRVSSHDAQKIKHEEGLASTKMVQEGKVFNISVHDRPDRIIEQRVLATIIEERVKEIFELIRDEIGKSVKRSFYSSRVVLTGGGSLLKGVQEVAEEVLEMPVRIGKPYNLKGVSDFVDSPIYATAVGLIHYGLENRNIAYPVNADPEGIRINVKKNITEFLKKFF